MAAAGADIRPLLGFRDDDEDAFAASPFELKTLGSPRRERSGTWARLFGSLCVRKITIIAVVACSVLSIGSLFIS
jgi:hypothetical protein